MYNTNIIVFSEDRAMQLDALLQSFNRFIDRNSKLTIMYKYSDEDYKKGYDHLKTIYTKHDFIKIIDFKRDLIEVLRGSNTQYTMVLTDKNIFIRHLDPNIIKEFRNKELFSISLKLGKTKKDEQPVSNLYFYRNYTGEYNDPFGLDGMIYRTSDFMAIASNNEFESPSSLVRSYVYNINRTYMYISNNPSVISIEDYTPTIKMNNLFLKGKVINFMLYSYKDYDETMNQQPLTFEWRR